VQAGGKVEGERVGPPWRLERVLTAVHVDLIALLFRQYAAELAVDLCFQGFAEELAGLPGAYSPPRGRLLLGWVGEEAAGCVALRPRSADTCEMKRLFVLPPFRRTGLGRLLAERVIFEARSIGYRRVVLDTLAPMHAALQLYQSLGFRSCPAYYPNPLPDVVYLELVLS
jgi:putative acetyltransferase